MLVTARYLGWYSSKAISAFKTLESTGLVLAEEKTEKVLITNRRKRNYARIRIGNYITTSKPAIKYLEVMADGKINLKEYIECTCEKSSTTSVALGRKMSNVGGPRYTFR